jgi:hypothetical protein
MAALILNVPFASVVVPVERFLMTTEMLESSSPASSFTVPVMVFCCAKESVGRSSVSKKTDGRKNFIPVLRLDKMDISNVLFYLLAFNIRIFFIKKKKLSTQRFQSIHTN